MRILKYLFLIVLLITIGITVYISTQNGKFEASESSIIKAQKITVFDYINDYKNWETFGYWMKKDSNINFNYPSKTMGAGAYCSWENGYDSGNIKTVFVKESDSIIQKTNFNGTKAEIRWFFKDTVGGTKVTIHSKGHMDIFTKFSSFFSGGISTTLKNIFKSSLHNLDKTLAIELKTYTIKVNGIVQRSSGYCLKQTITCKTKSIQKNIKIILPQMMHFFKKNNLQMTGKPYVRYDRFDTTNDIVTLSVCAPVGKQIYIMPGSDISSGETEAFTCLKTTLTGDYSHSKEAWNAAKKYISDNGLKENTAGKYVEVYVKTIDDIKSPSKWITELYIPVFPKTTETKPTIPATVTTNTTEVPISTSTVTPTETP